MKKDILKGWLFLLSFRHDRPRNALYDPTSSHLSRVKNLLMEVADSLHLLLPHLTRAVLELGRKGHAPLSPLHALVVG